MKTWFRKKCKHPLTALVKGNTGYFCKDCGNRVDDEVAALIEEAKEIGKAEVLAAPTQKDGDE